MRKVLLTVMLLLSLASAFADGHPSNPNPNCPPGQLCKP